MLWVFCYSYSSTAQAEVNQYGVDCSLTPWMSSCGDEWKTQDGMTEYSISDDGNVQVPIPFDFPYGYDGRTFTNSWMFSNGVVGFMSPTGSFCCNGIDVANGDWSNYTGLPYFSFSIAALWTDLIDLNVDFDGDGVDDVDEIKKNTDATDSTDYPKAKLFSILLFVIAIILVGGALGFFGYMRYNEAKKSHATHPLPPIGPTGPPLSQPPPVQGAPQVKHMRVKRHLSARERLNTLASKQFPMA